MIGLGDTEQWEYAGFYFTNNISFKPIPHLSLINNQVGYPYGANNVFQPWGLERDLFYALFHSIVGIEGTIQYYYLASIIITAIGSFLILLIDYSTIRAGTSALIITFFNFYGFHKYPHHLSISVAHWSILGILLDFLIVKKVFTNQQVTIRLILLRMLLLVLAFGQELGYITGYSLTSFAFSSIFVFIWIFITKFFSKGKTKISFKSLVFSFYKETKLYYFQIIILSASLLVTSLYYAPLIATIVRQAKSFDFYGVPGGGWWAHYARFLIPFLPKFNPTLPFWDKFFWDAPEGLGAGSPGWFLLIIGFWGLWQSRKKLVIFIPLLTILFLGIFFHPFNFPYLKILPWFSFFRVGGRSTIIYPVILVIFALELNLNVLTKSKKYIIGFILVFLACTELYVGYSFKFGYQPYIADPNLFKYMEYVKEQPGEAVLDWPFCVAAGNGQGAHQGLCPYNALYSAYSLRRFHQKKVIGQHFGRLHPSQIEPYLQVGWERLLLPNSEVPLQATQQARCFDAEEWDFFEQFYKYNDFAGINLYTTLLPDDCVQQFHQRVGQPIIQTTIPSQVQIQFIPKDKTRREQVDLVKGKELKFQPNLAFEQADLLEYLHPRGLSYSGLNPVIDRPEHENEPLRLAFGPETKLTFFLDKPRSLNLSIKFYPLLDKQTVQVVVNGKLIDDIVDVSQGEFFEKQYKINSTDGENKIQFIYGTWNHKDAKTRPYRHDERLLSVQFRKLNLQETLTY
ncbi:MAG: hypothetical protein ACOC4B_00390 [Bacteroidota bacterium]